MSTTVVDEEFRRRLRLIMQQFGSVADLARAVGVSDNAIYKWVSGRGQPGMISLVNLAKAAGVSVEWLATGRGVQAKVRPEPPPPAEHVRFATMPVHTLKAQGGRSIRSAQIVDHLGFRIEWVQQKLNLDPAALALIEAVGDSMSPTLDEGDLALVNLHEARFRHDGLYALLADGDLTVKRVQRQPDGTLLIRCDNPAYESMVVKPDQAGFLGRVVWIGGRP